MNEATVSLGSDAAASVVAPASRTQGPPRRHRGRHRQWPGDLRLHGLQLLRRHHRPAVLSASSPLASLLLSFATFGAGFVMRPLGAVLIGNMADRRGRKAALTLTIGLMTAGTALLAFTPSYASIGVTATALVVVGRLLQGLSAGGEVGARRRC
jgi:MHS family proline/betaine transporter-like MFS transporter